MKWIICAWISFQILLTLLAFKISLKHEHSPKKNQILFVVIGGKRKALNHCQGKYLSYLVRSICEKIKISKEQRETLIAHMYRSMLEAANEIYAEYISAGENIMQISLKPSLLKLKKIIEVISKEDFGIDNSTGAFSDLFSDKETISYVNIHSEDDDERFSFGLFFIPKGGLLPLHDHPQMFVFSKILMGSVKRQSYSLQNPLIQLEYPHELMIQQEQKNQKKQLEQYQLYQQQLQQQQQMAYQQQQQLNFSSHYQQQPLLQSLQYSLQSQQEQQQFIEQKQLQQLQYLQQQQREIQQTQNNNVTYIQSIIPQQQQPQISYNLKAHDKEQSFHKSLNHQNSNGNNKKETPKHHKINKQNNSSNNNHHSQNSNSNNHIHHNSHVFHHSHNSSNNNHNYATTSSNGHILNSNNNSVQVLTTSSNGHNLNSNNNSVQVLTNLQINTLNFNSNKEPQNGSHNIQTILELQNHKNLSPLVEASLDCEEILDEGFIDDLDPMHKNLHSIEAISDCVLFDVLLPHYDLKKRFCNYYNVIQCADQQSKKAILQILDQPLHQSKVQSFKINKSQCRYYIS